MGAENTTVSFRIATAKVQALGRLASLQDRDRSYLLNEAVEQYLALNDFHTEHIREGLRQAERGQMVSDDDAQAHMLALVDQAKRR